MSDSINALLNRASESDDRKRSGTESGSDNYCSDNRSDSEFDSPEESTSRGGRRTRVGLRGGKGLQHTPAAKLAARTIKQSSGCWECQGHALPGGYRQIYTGGTPAVVSAHRLAWELANGRPVPKGQVVMHSCDNPRCVNPAHLSIGTQHQNIIDSVRKGRYNVFGRQKLTAEQVLEIRARAQSGEPQKSIAKSFNIARNTVSGIVHRTSWAHLDDRG